MEDKYCYRCRSRKPLNQFSKDRSTKDGLNNRCKLCDRVKVKKWTKDNKIKVVFKDRKKDSKRRARIKNLPNDLTPDQWLFSLYFFNHQCAYCGRPFNGAKEYKCSMDHFQPISTDEKHGTTALNIVPCCIGKGGCNNKKGNKDPHKWMIEEFGVIKAQEISTRIHYYFETVKRVYRIS